MPTFSVEAMDNKGKRIKADIDASSANDAIAKLKQKGYKPMNVKEKAASAAVATPPPTPAAAPAGGAAPTQRAAAAPPISAVPTGGKQGRKGFFFAGRVKHKQLTQFTQQLSVLMDAGLPIVRSLKILGNQQKPGLLKNIVLEVSEDVETGSSFSEALAKHPKTFDKLYVNMIKAGEAGGVLDVILQRLATFMERMEALKRKIIGASIYPAVVITIAVAVVLAIMKFIVPKFREVFTQVKVEMPALTVMLMGISNFIESFWYIILATPFVFWFIIKAWGRTKGGRLALDKMKLSAPLIGMIIKKSVIARFCRTLGTLLQSGVPILEALAIVKNATGNEVVSNAIGTVHDSIREGESIAEPLAACGVFDDIVINMIDVGEETGELDKMLLKIADNYDAEVDAAVSALMSVMEPILIVGLGFTVGFIVVALFLPLISLLEGIGGSKRR
ncbi:MAG TPA: type II secretion system F family protein [Planctomycetota bacterium]|nr:type II secretion system F family protein [Planctomycetota bacterium]